MHRMGNTVHVIPLLRACHFQPTVAVTAITTALALSAGRGSGSIWVALAVLSGQLSVGWSNDYLDRDRDHLANRDDKPIVSGEVNARTVGVSAVIAAVACVPLSMLSGWRAGSIHIAAVAIAWSYNLWLKRTIASAVPFALAFGALPAFVTLGLPEHPWPPVWAVAAAALMGTAAHFVNTLPDFDADAKTDVIGLPHRVGPRISLFVAVLLMTGATLVLAVAGSDPLGSALTAVAFAVVIAIVVASVTSRVRFAWSLTLCVAALNVAAFIASGESLTG